MYRLIELAHRLPRLDLSIITEVKLFHLFCHKSKNLECNLNLLFFTKNYFKSAVLKKTLILWFWGI